MESRGFGDIKGREGYIYCMLTWVLHLWSLDYLHTKNQSLYIY